MVTGLVSLIVILVSNLGQAVQTVQTYTMFNY